MKKNNEESTKSNLENEEKNMLDKGSTYTMEVPLEKKTVAALIKALRKTRKYSQEQFGELIGVQKSQVSKLERGGNNITLASMVKIFTALNVKVILKVELEKKEDLKAIEKKLKAG